MDMLILKKELSMLWVVEQAELIIIDTNIHIYIIYDQTNFITLQFLLFMKKL